MHGQSRNLFLMLFQQFNLNSLTLTSCERPCSYKVVGSNFNVKVHRKADRYDKIHWNGLDLFDIDR